VIRPATPEDLPAIAGIQAGSLEAAAWNPLDFKCSVAEIDGRVAGFLVTRQSCPGESEILNLAVHPAFRRRRIAETLLRDALATAKGAWFLEVRESNQPAIRLYESLGFERAGRRENYYTGPTEAAIVMRFFS
jgi:ribosomal-protein-alanine N-acetyltransferase